MCVCVSVCMYSVVYGIEWEDTLYHHITLTLISCFLIFGVFSSLKHLNHLVSLVLISCYFTAWLMTRRQSDFYMLKEVVPNYDQL